MASVAVYRELVGHDDAADLLGPSPKPGQVESYAAWRSAWRALGRPEADRAEADEVRAAWYAHTAGTRAAAERAAAELATRRADLSAELPPITAKEWLAAHDAEARAEDPYRPVTEEHDLADTENQRAHDQREVRTAEPSPESAGTSTRDIREAAAQDAEAKVGADRFGGRDVVRVPTADETAESVRRAQRALHELKQRQDADARRAEDDARSEASRRPNDVDQHLDNNQLLVDSPSR